MTEKQPLIEDQGSRIILRGNLGESVILDVLMGEPGADEFRELFDLDPEDYIGDPTDSFYQVITFTRIITRKSDGAKFGFSYTAAPGHDHMETSYEQDLEELGIELEYDGSYELIGEWPYVFLPVEPFQRTGYTVKKD